MARDPRKAQKAKERRNKRAKEKQKAAARLKSLSPLAVFNALDGSVVTRCTVHSRMDEDGITNLFVSREFPNGIVVLAVFLVDLKCLGVKNVIFEKTNAGGAAAMARMVYSDGGPPVPITPAEAKKLCLGSVAFAAKYGLPPHPDYAQAVKIFDGIDETTCGTEFTFGKDGQPFYIAGPRDGLTNQRRVIDTLERTAGPGGYDFVIPIDAGLDDELPDDPDDDFDGEEDDDPPEGGWALPPRQW